MTDVSPRSHVLRMVLGVLIIDVMAIGAYLLGGLGTAPPRTRLAFAAVWTIATLVVVLVGLRRIREARVAGRGRRPSP